MRELAPQDLKLEIDPFSEKQAAKAARYLAFVVGKANARQMDEATVRNGRAAWMPIGGPRSMHLLGYGRASCHWQVATKAAILSIVGSTRWPPEAICELPCQSRPFQSILCQPEEAAGRNRTPPSAR